MRLDILWGVLRKSVKVDKSDTGLNCKLVKEFGILIPGTRVVTAPAESTFIAGMNDTHLGAIVELNFLFKRSHARTFSANQRLSMFLKLLSGACLHSSFQPSVTVIPIMEVAMRNHQSVVTQCFSSFKLYCQT